MGFYLVAGHGASTDLAVSGTHLPRGRVRRYPSDTTDAEWQVLAPSFRPGGPAGEAGPAAHSRRDIIDAIRYLAHNGCVWRPCPPTSSPMLDSLDGPP